MRRFRRPLTALLGLVMTAMIASAPSFADPAPSPGPSVHASPAAKAAGISRLGQAYMGWSLQDHALSTKRTTAQTPAGLAAPGPKGIDVSAWNTDVNWTSVRSGGSRFAYIKATEGNYYTSATFSTQYTGAYDAGLIRGAYHFANPSMSSGASQADYFVDHGGGWSPDGWTLPGVLDIEYDPYGPTCYGLTPSDMTAWIRSFTTRYRHLTGRDAVIYSTYDWWNQCTGNTSAFNQTNPLWIARYASSPGLLPGGWNFYTFWQYSATPIDQDWFNGTYARLQQLAAPGPPSAPPCSAAPFRDVLTTNHFCPEIAWLEGQHITSGYVDGRFRPRAAVSRQAFAHYLYEIDEPGRPDGPCTASALSAFSDVPNTSKFCISIRALSRSGIINGYPDGKFHPKAPISRQAIAALIAREAIGGGDSIDSVCTLPIPFNDVTSANTFCGAIERIHDMGLSEGYKDGGYHPTSPTSRQAIAAFLYRYDRRVL